MEIKEGFGFKEIILENVDEFIEIQADGLQRQLYACVIEPSA